MNSSSQALRPGTTEETLSNSRTINAKLVGIDLYVPARHRPQELCESRGGRPGLPSL